MAITRGVCSGRWCEDYGVAGAVGSLEDRLVSDSARGVQPTVAKIIDYATVFTNARCREKPFRERVLWSILGSDLIYLLLKTVAARAIEKEFPMAQFSIGFESFKVENCRSKGDHNDSDWLILTVTNGSTAFPSQTKEIGGNLHAGDSVSSFFLGPFSIDETHFTTVTFLVLNLSKEDNPNAKANGVALQIDGGILAAVGGGIAIGGALSKSLIAGIVGGVISLVGGVIATIGTAIGSDSDPNCDGEIFTRVFTFGPGEFTPHSIGPVLESVRSPSECGNDPHTTVAYGFRAFKHKIPSF
jgi:hypothetical protein